MSTLASPLIQMNTRRDVLRLYKQLLQYSKNWIAKDPEKTDLERKAIKDEIRSRFRENKNVEDELKIRNLIQYSKNRIDIAEHYGIPFERPLHYQQGTKIKKKKKPS